MKKFLIVCGPTATGKTSLGLLLAKKFNGEIISADSRQVYKGMNIGTGKDIPKSFKPLTSHLQWGGKGIPYFNNSTKIWGYNLVDPDEEFSVAHFINFATVVLNDIWERNKLPIIVGGTGLYLQAITRSIDTIHIPPNEKLRDQLSNKSVKDLQKILIQIESERFQTMNQSDRKNPRRLIRAIEISEYKEKGKHVRLKKIRSADKTLWIGLTAEKKYLFMRIDDRVERRLREGAEEEVNNLLK